MTDTQPPIPSTVLPAIRERAAAEYDPIADGLIAWRDRQTLLVLLDEASARPTVERQMLEAEAVRATVLELHRERGRMQKVMVGDFLAVLGAVRNLSDDALRAALDRAAAAPEGVTE